MALMVGWHRLRVRLWCWSEKRLRVAYDQLVDAEARRG